MTAEGAKLDRSVYAAVVAAALAMLKETYARDLAFVETDTTADVT